MRSAARTCRARRRQTSMAVRSSSTGMERNLMRPASFPGLYGNPFMAWTQLAWKAGELMMSSGEVVGRRMAGMALAGPFPRLRDRRELALMTREKTEAAAASGYALWSYLAQLNQQLAALALKQMFAGTATMMSLASSRTAAESIGRQTKLAADTIA